MALINCPECGHEKISDKAAMCPDCGFPIAEHFKEIENEKREKEERIKRKQREEERRQREEERRQEANRQRIVDAFSAAFTEMNDWYDVMNYIKVVQEDIGNRVCFDVPVTFVTLENVDKCISNISKGNFEYPYIVTTAELEYDFNQKRKRKMIKSDGSVVEEYFDERHISALIAPKISIYVDDKGKINDVLNPITDAYKDIIEIRVPDLMEKSDLIPTCFCYENKVQIEDIGKKGNLNCYRVGVKFKKGFWPQCIDTKYNKINNKYRANFRMAQLALACGTYINTDLSGELKLYSRLNENVGFFKDIFGPAYTNQYMELKNILAKGQPFTADLVDGAFPRMSFIYHDIPINIAHRTSVNELKAEIDNILEIYKKMRSKVFEMLELPDKQDIPYAEYMKTTSMRNNYGLEAVTKALSVFPNMELEDVIKEYYDGLARKARAAYEEEQEQLRYEAEHPVSEPSSDGGSSGFLGSLAGGFVGSAMASNNSKRGKSGKKSYKGSAGCALSRGKSCMMYNCNLWDDCADRR